MKVSIFRPTIKGIKKQRHLEYGYSAIVWNPHFKKQITLIENVQRRTTKQIPGLAHLSYLERLQLLKLPTLQYRRYRGDMIEMYKLSHGHYDEAATRSFLNFLPCGAITWSGHVRVAHSGTSKLKILPNLPKIDPCSDP